MVLGTNRRGFNGIFLSCLDIQTSPSPCLAIGPPTSLGRHTPNDHRIAHNLPGQSHVLSSLQGQASGVLRGWAGAIFHYFDSRVCLSICIVSTSRGRDPNGESSGP